MTDPTENSPVHVHPVQWQRHLEQEHSLDELKALCCQLGLNPESLPHNTKPEFSRELVAYFNRHGRLAALETAHKTYHATRQSTLGAYRRGLLDDTEYIELKGVPPPRPVAATAVSTRPTYRSTKSISTCKLSPKRKNGVKKRPKPKNFSGVESCKQRIFQVAPIGFVLYWC